VATPEPQWVTTGFSLHCGTLGRSEECTLASRSKGHVRRSADDGARWCRAARRMDRRCGIPSGQRYKSALGGD
jgi:hypothetical protein